RPRAGMDALLAVVDQLAGAPIPASALFDDVIPARIARFRPADLDQLAAAGELTWIGVEPLGATDGRIALYPADRIALLAPPARLAEGDLPARLRALFERRGALFFSDLTRETGAFPGDLLKAIWEMVWAGELTNDT